MNRFFSELLFGSLLFIYLFKFDLLAEEIFVGKWENDLFFQNSDHYYSNGLRLEYWRRPAPIELQFLQFLLKGVFLTTECGNANRGLVIGQNLYTPTEVERSFTKKGDRNYAGWLYLGHLYSIECERSVLFWEVSIGTLGKNSYAEQVQDLVHKVVNSEKPLGWNTQISNSLSFQNHLNYKYFYSPFIGLETNLKLGNVFTSYGTGILFRYGNIKSNTIPNLDIADSSAPPEFHEGEKFFYIRAFGWKQIYDGTLQGGNIVKGSTNFRISESQQNSYLLNREKTQIRDAFSLDWNRENTFTGRYLYFYNLYRENLPDNLPLNMILFHTLFNGNPRITDPTKNMLLFVLRDKDWYTTSIDEKILYLAAIFHNGSAQSSNLLYILALRYFIENIVDSSLTLEQIYLFKKFQNNQNPIIQPRKIQGKLQIGFAWTLEENLFLQLGLTLSTSEFYPETGLPQNHKWGGFQITLKY